MRVILADDAVLFREGLARILSEAGIEVAGQASNAAELLDLVRRDPPEVAIIDIRMPPGHSDEGTEAAFAIRKMAPDVGLLLLSQHVETTVAMRLITEFQGGVGYLLKDRVSDLDAFASDVRRIANGDCVIDPETGRTASDGVAQRLCPQGERTSTRAWHGGAVRRDPCCPARHLCGLPVHGRLEHRCGTGWLP